MNSTDGRLYFHHRVVVSNILIWGFRVFNFLNTLVFIKTCFYQKQNKKTCNQKLKVLPHLGKKNKPKNQKLEVLFKTKIWKQWSRPIFDKIKRLKPEKTGRVVNCHSHLSIQTHNNLSNPEKSAQRISSKTLICMHSISFKIVPSMCVS
jgi:hypothetical protein